MRSLGGARRELAKRSRKRVDAGVRRIQLGDVPTERQREVHTAMLQYQADNNGMPASLRELCDLLDIELCDLLDIKSTNAITDHLLALEKRGLVRHHRPRASRAWIALQPAPEGT